MTHTFSVAVTFIISKVLLTISMCSVEVNGDVPEEAQGIETNGESER